MRNAMRLASYGRKQEAWMRRAAVAFLTSYFAVLGLVMALATSVSKAAEQPVPPEANRYKLTLKREAQRVWGLNAPVASFAAQIHQESAWNPEAKSTVGAQGLSQFMPGTATWISGLYPSLEERAPLNPTWAIRALVIYDTHLYTAVRHADDDCQRFAFALSAYNGGLGWVNKRQAASNHPGRCFDMTCDINPGITPAAQRENARYPRVILQRHQATYAQWGLGICP